MIAEFFNPADGLLTDLTFSPSGTALSGYWDITEAEYFIDDEPSTTRATFVCATVSGYADLVGQKVTKDGLTFRVNTATPDGTGILTLNLFAV